MNTMFEPPAAALPGANAEAAVLGADVGALVGAVDAPPLEQAAANNARAWTTMVTRVRVRPCPTSVGAWAKQAVRITPEGAATVPDSTNRSSLMRATRTPE